MSNSVLFAHSKSVTTPDTSQNPEYVIDRNLGGVHSATPIIHCIKTPSVQTKDTHPSVGPIYLADDSFWREKILFLRRELENNKKTIDNLFNILRNNNKGITKQFFLYNNAAETKLSENVISSNSVINIDNNLPSLIVQKSIHINCKHLSESSL